MYGVRPHMHEVSDLQEGGTYNSREDNLRVSEQDDELLGKVNRR